MKAVICSKYGAPEVLKIKDIPKPEPRDNEILVKIHATTVHIGDTKIRRLEPGLGYYKDMFFKPIMRLMIGIRGPRKKILGMELAGKVESVGKNVQLFKAGDEVLASTDMKFGAYAEYTCLPEKGIVALKPKNMSFEEAAPLSNGALIALNILRKGSIKPGQKVLIYGASGSVGTFAIQLALHYRAHVTGVCSTDNVELVKSLGADHVIDYKKEDFSLSEERYDMIFDAVAKIPRPKRKIGLKQGGTYLNVLSDSNDIKLRSEDLKFICELCEADKLKAVIDRTYPMEEIIEAHRYVDKGHKKGNVVITI